MGLGLTVFNRTILGESFSEDIKRAVWAKGEYAPGWDYDQYRLDACGALICWDDYGITDDKGNGWEIDHIQPVSRGGSDELSNLQPLQWQNNRRKGNQYPISPNSYKAVWYE
ncbi:HNH endonuclease signature motif containing protein [Desulfovibrio caledoniensis]